MQQEHDYSSLLVHDDVSKQCTASILGVEACNQHEEHGKKMKASVFI
jgi:hypothetical protein